MRTQTRLETIAMQFSAALVLGGTLLLSWAAADSMPLEELRAEREKAAHRERRVIFNNDGNEPVYLCKDNTPEELLRHRTSDIAGTHVDAISYCTWSSGFGMFTHDTNVGSVFDTQEGLFSNNRITEMLAAGGALPHHNYQNVPTLNPNQPKSLEPGKAAEVEFVGGSDFMGIEADKPPRITLRLRFENLKSPEDVAVQLNKEALASPQAVEDWLEFSLQPDQLQQGSNAVTLSLADGAEPASWTDLHCTVRWSDESK